MAEVSFGEWLKRQRNARGLTQEQLARQVGCAAITLRKIEAEERRPSEQIAMRLADIFNISSKDRENFLRYARGAWVSASIEVETDMPWRAGSKAPRSNLPGTVTSLIGREKELADIRGYVLREDIRLITLIGPPGIGKTRLSIEVARLSLPDFPDGIFFVALAPLDDPTLIASTTLQALGYVESKNLPADKQLMKGIRDKRMLIVLDNCEHLIEDAALLASNLLSACSRLKILTTSRESLRVMGEQLYPVPALEVPKEGSALDVDVASAFPALTLFAERARSVRPDFALNAENLPAVSTICAKLDGLPLAIELIAARMRLMLPQALLERMTDQFILSADGVRAVSDRQKTLQNAIGWSYSLLSEEEQKLFARLSVFSGGFTLEAAEAMFSRTITEKAMADLIASLLDKSLLQRAFDHKTHAPRFSMLVTIQQFALTRLRQMDDEATVRDWHLACFLDLAERADKNIHGPDQLEWINRVDDELDNFRSALHWCVSNQKTEPALRLLTSLSWAWMLRDRLREARNWFHAIRSLPGVMDDPLLHARLLNRISQHGHSWLLNDPGEYRSLLALLDESRERLAALGVEGEQELAKTLYVMGRLERAASGQQSAQLFLEQSLEILQRHGDQWETADVMFNLGKIAHERNEDRLALSLFKQSLALFHQWGDVWSIAQASEWLGRLFLKQENFEQAQLLLNQHLVMNEKLDYKLGITTALKNLGDFYRYQGIYGRAEEFYSKAASIGRELDLGWEDFSFNDLGLIALHRNEYVRAAQYFEEFYRIFRNQDERFATIVLLYALAAVAAGTHQPERAARLYGTARALIESSLSLFLVGRLSAPDLAEFERHIQIAREQLGNAKFDELMAEGRAMTIEQAIVYALEETHT